MEKGTRIKFLQQKNFGTKLKIMKMKRIIFVGMHNKPDKLPLCSSTKSGKLIDRIIKNFPNIEFIKTNLYDIEYYPVEGKYDLAFNWHQRIDSNILDIVILLGAEVHHNFVYQYCYSPIIKLAHPSSKRSFFEMDEYVVRASKLILNLL